MNMAGHSMAPETVEVAPPDKLPPPLHMTGLGNSHLSITATPAAQVWFDQGLNLMHDFWEYESARAFQQAVREDPNCAMCYWGLADALRSRHGVSAWYAKEALAAAVRLKPRASKAEQLYIDAAVAAETEGKRDAEIAIRRKLVKDHPADLQAKIFLEESLAHGYDELGKPRKGTEEAIGILRDALVTAPNDSALNHYWIHLVEPGAHPEQAIPSARLLASLAPASGHMVHMPGHIFYLAGDYAQAEQWFAASTAVDENYMLSQHIDIDDDWNYVHNLMYAIANLMEEGKLQQAGVVTAKLSRARGRFQSTLYTQAPRDGMTRLDLQIPMALRAGDWPRIVNLLDAVKPDAKLENLAFLAGQLRQFAAGMQAVEAGDLLNAAASSTELDAALWRNMQTPHDTAPPPAKTPDQPPRAVVMPDALLPPVIATLSIMSLELRACILAAQQRVPEAEALFKMAGEGQKELGYREPPMYIRPVSETEGYALLQAKEYALAHGAFVAAAAERPRSGFALYGAARSSELAGNTVRAHAEYETFLSAWKDADPSLPQVQHAHAYGSAASLGIAVENQH